MIVLAAKMYFKADPAFFKKLDTSKKKIAARQARMIQVEAKRLMSKKVTRAADRKEAGGKRVKGRRSRPGEMPRSDSGNYRRSIKYKVFRATAIVGPTVPLGSHAGMLKYGTKKMGARLVPVVVALERSRSRLLQVAKGKL